MKRILYLTILLLGATTLAQAQPTKQSRERIEALRVQFITQKLALTPDEAKGFWPVYDAYQAELKKLKKQFRNELQVEPAALMSMKEEEAEKILQERVQLKLAEATLYEKYTNEFKKVLPVKKVVLLQSVETSFKKELLQRLRQQRRGGRE